MNNFQRYITSTIQKMESKYRISTDIELSDGTIASMTASRTHFSWKGLVLISQHILIVQMENPTVSDFKQLFEAGYNFAKETNRIPLLRGMQFGYMVIPVIVTSNPSDDLINYAQSAPENRWCIFDFPVLLDLVTNNVHYYQQTSFWGAFFFSDLRKIASKYLTPIMP